MNSPPGVRAAGEGLSEGDVTTTSIVRLTYNDLPKNQITWKVSLRLVEKTCKNKGIGVQHEYAGRVSLFFEG